MTRAKARWLVGLGFAAVVACGSDGDANVGDPSDGGPPDGGTNGDASGQNDGAANDDAGDAGPNPCVGTPTGKILRVRGYAVPGVAYGVTSDATGNVWVAGSYNTNATPGSYSFASLPAPGSTGGDGFVVKRTAAGVEEWVRVATGSGAEIAAGLAADGADLYVSGTSSSASVTLDTKSTTSGAASHAWIAKLSAQTGAAAWIRAIPFNTSGISFGSCTKLVARGGKLYAICQANVTGSYTDTNMLTQNLTLIAGASGSTTFVLRLDPATGLVMWSNALGGNDGASAVVTDNGDVVLGGSFRGANIHDTANACVAARVGPSNSTFLARLNAATGACSEARSFGDGAAPASTGVITSDLALDAQGKLLFAGTFASSTNLGTGVLTQTAAPSGFNAFFASFASGSAAVASSARAFPTTHTGVAADSCGRPALAIETTGDVTVDGKVFVAGAHVLSLDPATNGVLWAKGIAGDVNTAEVRTLGFGSAPGGRLLLIGRFSGMRDLGDGTPLGLGLPQQPFLVEYAPY